MPRLLGMKIGSLLCPLIDKLSYQEILNETLDPFESVGGTRRKHISLYDRARGAGFSTVDCAVFEGYEAERKYDDDGQCCGSKPPECPVMYSLSVCTAS